MDQSVGGQDLFRIDTVRVTFKVGYFPACLGNHQARCSDIPGVEFKFPESIETARCQISKIDGCRARPPNSKALGNELTKIAKIEISVLMNIIRKAGTEKTSVQPIN